MKHLLEVDFAADLSVVVPAQIPTVSEDRRHADPGQNRVAKLERGSQGFELMNRHASLIRVHDEAPIEEVEQALKKDAALGVNLLRIINSAGVGLNHRVTSLHQTVMLMGYQRLSRWSVMLLTTSAEGRISLLSSAAVVRARMMEILALQDLSAEESESAFLVGLLSLLDRMLGIDLRRALEQLSLDREVMQSLLEPNGKYAALLALSIACESEDDAAFNAAFVRLGYTLRQINMAHMEALAWSDALE